MGSWNYYIELKSNDSVLYSMLCEYKQNDIYQTAFQFSIVEDDCKDGFNAIFSSVIDNFLTGNYLIYDFLSNFVSYDSCIRANGIEHLWNFTKKSDFIKFVYDSWQDKIDFVYRQLGTIMIDCKHYHKIRNKLYKKYFKKI